MSEKLSESFDLSSLQKKLRKWVLLSLVAVLGATGAQDVFGKDCDCKEMTRAEIIELLLKTPFGQERRKIAEKCLSTKYKTERCHYFEKDGAQVFGDCDDGDSYWQFIEKEGEIGSYCEEDKNRNLIPDDKE